MKYIGNGAAIPGIPARDLTTKEVEQYGGEKLLLATGIYAKSDITAKPTKRNEVK